MFEGIWQSCIIFTSCRVKFNNKSQLQKKFSVGDISDSSRAFKTLASWISKRC